MSARVHRILSRPSSHKTRFVLVVLLLSVLAHWFVIDWARDSLALVALLDDSDEDSVITISLQPAPGTSSEPAAPASARPLLPRVAEPADTPAAKSTLAEPTPAAEPPAPAPTASNPDAPAEVAAGASPAAAAPATETAAPSAPATPVMTPADPPKVASPAEPVPAPPQAHIPPGTPPAPEAAPLFDRISLPPSAELSYDALAIKGNSKVEGRGVVSWQQDGRQYSINGEANVLFLSVLSYRSTGSVGAMGIAPELYVEKRLGKSATNTHFHRERQTISFSASTHQYPVRGGEQDRGSVFWQLAGLARGNPDKLVAGFTFEMIIAGHRTADPWQVQVVGREPLPLTGGSTDAWHLIVRPLEGNPDYQLEVWLAPDTEWYPVKIMYVDRKGATLGLTLSKLAKK